MYSRNDSYLKANYIVNTKKEYTFQLLHWKAYSLITFHLPLTLPHVDFKTVSNIIIPIYNCYVNTNYYNE